MRREEDGAVLEMRRSAAETEMDMEIDEEFFDDTFDAEALLANIQTSLEDPEPWQRLSEVLGRITGEIDSD